MTDSWLHWLSWSADFEPAASSTKQLVQKELIHNNILFQPANLPNICNRWFDHPILALMEKCTLSKNVWVSEAVLISPVL